MLREWRREQPDPGGPHIHPHEALYENSRIKKTPSNIAASVRARLLNIAKARGDNFQFLLTQYANERILYRLTRST